MKIRISPDVVEIGAEEVDEAIRRLVLEKTGREMVAITWVNADTQNLIGGDTRKLVYLNAILKPESEA